MQWRSRPMLLCGIAAFFAYAYFYEAGGWNQNTRFDLVRALVEHRGIQIDEYQSDSGDMARFGSHYYADKGPGASFTAAPFVALTRAVMRALHANPHARANLEWQSYVASLAAAALPGALAVMCVWSIARRMGTSQTGANVVALAFGLGTPFWAWATIFYSHALSAACLLGAFLATLALKAESPTASRDLRLGSVIGLLIGWAVVTEYWTAVPGGVLVLYALAQVWRDRRRLVRVATVVAITGGACAVFLGAYDYAAFRSPFHLSYASEENSTLLRNGFFGLTYPKSAIVKELLWGSFRGLLPLAPVLALVPIGWVLAFRSRAWWGAMMAAAVAFLLVFALNASYEHWEGGWSFGPRQLGSVVGFAALGLVPVWMYGGRLLRVLVVVLAIAGAGCAVVGVSTTAQPPGIPQFEHPMRDLLWPAFREGQLSLNRQSYFDRRPAGEIGGPQEVGLPRAQWNVGEKMGLKGLPSLLPLAGVLALTIALAFRIKD